jgi:hypothetical protein
MSDPNERWPEYLFTYHFDGADYGFSILARSEAEARARIKMLPLARYDGELVERIPAAIPGAGLWVRLSCAVQNWLRAKEPSE